MAVPKRKTSKTRKNKRRASAYKLPKVTVSECPQCHEAKLPHRVCASCGYYGGKKVVDMDD